MIVQPPPPKSKEDFMTLFERLKKEALYAQASFSRDLLYKVHGASDMAYELGGIDWAQCCELNDLTVRASA